MYIETILEYLKQEYNSIPEYLFSRFPGYAVFRNTKNKKWYAVIMNVSNNILGIKEEGYTNILNIKCEPPIIEMLLEKKGYFRAYHMNKKHWISVSLSGIVKKSEILKLIENSYNLVNEKN